MSGVKGKSGRKHKTLTRARALQSLTQKLPKAIEVIGETMEGTVRDRLRYEAAIQIKDSVMGKPKAVTELDISGGEQIGAGVVVELMTILTARWKELEQRKLIEGGNYAIQGQGTDKGSYEEIQGKEEGDNGEG